MEGRREMAQCLALIGPLEGAEYGRRIEADKGETEPAGWGLWRRVLRMREMDWLCVER